jgi:NADPH-dependent 2,4-dienoyl-CoA reductase/sulfur reductase-like enzyme
MIDDFRAYDGGGVLECDLCIAGAGAAGITLAMSFAGRRERVILLESGGRE